MASFPQHNSIDTLPRQFPTSRFLYFTRLTEKLNIGIFLGTPHSLAGQNPNTKKILKIKTATLVLDDENAGYIEKNPNIQVS